MKKKVKSLIIAASVAAIAGIGAVSFAAWNNSTNDTANSGSVNTGSVTINAGFVSADGNAVSMALADTNKSKLMPYDQPGALDTDQTTSLVFNIPDFQVKKGVDYKFTLSTTDFSGIEFKYQIGAAAATVPTDETGYNDAAWIAIGTATSDFTAESTDKVITGQKLTIIMNSDDFADMGKTGSFTLTFDEVTA